LSFIASDQQKPSDTKGEQVRIASIPEEKVENKNKNKKKSPTGNPLIRLVSVLLIR